MRILILSPKQDGCHVWREAIPARALRALGHKVTVTSNPADALGPADLLVLSPCVAVEAPDQFVERVKAKRIVYDVDDALDWVSVCSPAFAAPHYFHCYHYFVQVADLVTTTTDRLRAHLRPMRGAGPIAVLPNLADARLFPRPRARRAAAPPRVGWAGSSTHLVDLLPLAQALVRLQRRTPFTPVLMGLGAARTAGEWLRTFLPRTTREVRAAATELGAHLAELEGLVLARSVPVADYPAALTGLALDVAACPLAPSAFNRCKSPIKFYESVLAGAATLASDVPPYSDDLPDPYLVRHTVHAWEQRIGELIEDRTARARLHKKQREWVVANRTIDASIEDREAVYEELLSASER